MSDYVKSVVDRYILPDTLDNTTQAYVCEPLCICIHNWARNYDYILTDIKLSGSRAKGTAITLASDLDILISLSSSNRSTLADIYGSLYNYLVSYQIECRKQNVSIGIRYNNKNIDLVPGKRQDQYGNDHSLYKRKQNSWTKTNIDTHIGIVKNSGRIVEIAATKVWRAEHNIDFPSIFLELVVINALKGHLQNDIDKNFLHVLDYIKNNIQTISIADPANTNNIISDDLSAHEKMSIAKQAYDSRQMKTWPQIIW